MSADLVCPVCGLDTYMDNETGLSECSDPDECGWMETPGEGI